ncbi:hypothetical protein KDK95_10030 [Actinospica sp. MGRD01-02]|uniref:Uncharacterized protein n=1 Tax=Actinospica acidithermotolerans TaxID=2828514 RepID=A0A941E9T8_9ACTN|nr:hypothetical protein [Actinospica acidithermotolerans]MBR7826643.1 hypothetical protein [Actinospica acidithermotolerans]
MNDTVELVSDGDGFLAAGDPAAVEQFLRAEGLWAATKKFDLRRLKPLFGIGAEVMRAGSEICADSARWLKLTPESAHLRKQHGLMATKTPGVSHALVGEPGKIAKWLQVEEGRGLLLTNPAVLSGAAGIMAQFARQHEMAEIKTYLATIDKKADKILRDHGYDKWADMDGAGRVIKDATIMRETKGRVDAITWSKVQPTNETIATVQRYALYQLGDLVRSPEGATNIRDIAKMTSRAEPEVRDWLAVLARCFELQDKIDVLELDRVLDESPDEADAHRLGLKRIRRERREEILGVTAGLMARMDSAAGPASSHVLLHLSAHRAAVGSINQLRVAVDDFHRPLGVESGRKAMEPRGWWDAAQDPMQWKTAGVEAGRVAVAVGAVAAGLVTLSAVKNATTKDE